MKQVTISHEQVAPSVSELEQPKVQAKIVDVDSMEEDNISPKPTNVE